MQRKVLFGVVLMTGFIANSCGYTLSYEVPGKVKATGKITDVDTCRDEITVDTGFVRKGPDVIISGAFAAKKVSPFLRKGDYVLFGYDSLTKKIDSNTVITIKK